MLCSLVICVFASLAIQTHCQNAPPSIDEKLYGPGKNCYFTFDDSVDYDYIKEKMPSSEVFGVGHLAEYRLAFNENGEVSTIVPASGEDVWGNAFLTCVEEFEAFMAGATDLNIIAVTVKVTKKDGAAKCNAYSLKKQPSITDPVPEQLKPDAYRLDLMMKAFKKAGIPADYSNKMKERFTRKC